MSAHSDRRHIVRAALESIGYQLRDVLDALRAESGIPFRRIHADGGATRNDFLMQFVADVTAAELCVAASPGFSPLGAAMMGMLGTGLIKSLNELAKLPRVETVFRPAADSQQVSADYLGWQRAVAQVLSASVPLPAGRIAI